MKEKQNNMKQVIVTKEDTDVYALAKILNEEQIQALISTLCMMDKVCIPQYYVNDDQARYYGFEDLEDMNKRTDHYYQHIDNDMFLLAESN